MHMPDEKSQYSPELQSKSPRHDAQQPVTRSAHTMYIESQICVELQSLLEVQLVLVGASPIGVHAKFERD
jgi:hypothetical protein